ncbi:MAG: DUF4926 domain-containing protein [Chloroflexi bacterium]|nr:DUF4926 domain-containing protein [Chloroflexota bacterium]
MPELFDLVELIIDIPERNLRAGMRGTIVHCHSETAFEVEFTNEQGETLDEWSFTTNQFIVVWRHATHDWVPLTEQAAALVAHLPSAAAHEVLDFARFLAIREQQKISQNNPKDMVEQLVTA